ncbi:MAG TPA: methyltransferase domain-containing protein [Methanosarcinales archaeon]|nr:methyltransferase domain-containing protein [Methanosarcinales archaeon]
MIKLNLGSGGRHLPGFLSVDLRWECGSIDCVHDISKPLPYKDNSVSVIFASHILEHFWWQDSEKLLKDWCRVLKPGGYLDVWTPDFKYIIDKYINGDPYRIPYENMKWVNNLIFSRSHMDGVVNTVNEHHAMFDRQYLKQCMKKGGFTKFVDLVVDKHFPFKNVHVGFNMGVRGYK